MSSVAGWICVKWIDQLKPYFQGSQGSSDRVLGDLPATKMLDRRPTHVQYTAAAYGVANSLAVERIVYNPSQACQIMDGQLRAGRSIVSINALTLFITTPAAPSLAGD